MGPEGSDCFDYESDIPEASPALWQHVFAADRTEKPKPRFDPMVQDKRVKWQEKLPENRARAKATPYVEVPPVPKHWGDQKAPLRESQPSQNPVPLTENPKSVPNIPVKDIHPPPKILKPPRPMERPGNYTNKNITAIQQENRGLKNQPNINKSDFVMKGDPRRPNPGPERTILPPRSPAKNRFTTNMQQRYSGDQVYKKVLNADVTLPLGELLAACPNIEKTLSSDTKLRTVPITHVRARDEDEEMVEAFAGLAPDSEEDAYTDVLQEDNYGMCYTAAASTPIYYGFGAKIGAERDPFRKSPISATGSFNLKIGERDVVAMVDSGAEMNMITPSLAEDLRDHFAEDENGKKFRMKNVSGVITNLKGQFNDIPLSIGGHRIPETFFVGDHWDSHFDVILGQTFLNNRACEMSWNGSDHILMRLYPSGNKEGDAITVRLTKHNDYNRKAMIARMGMAQSYVTDDLELSLQEIGNNGSATMPVQSVLSEFDPFWNDYPSGPEDTEVYLNPATLTLPTNDEDIASLSWDNDILANIISGIDYSSFWDIAAQADMIEEESHLRELDYMAARNTIQPSSLNPPSPQEMNMRFYRAVAALKQAGQLDTSHSTFEDIQDVYNSRIYKAFHHIPVGDKMFNIDEGEHAVRVNSKSLRAVLDPRLNHNLITRAAQQRTELETGVATWRDLGDEKFTDVEYCCPVLIELGVGPLLPGILMVTDDPIPGGYDILLGKPWMMGIECYFTHYRFSPSLNDFVYEPPGPDINPDLLVIAGADANEDDESVVLQGNAPTAEEDRALRRLRKLGHLHHTSMTEPPGNKDSQSDIPALGGVVARTL